MIGTGEKSPKATDVLVLKYDDGSRVTLWLDPSGMLLVGVGIGIVLAKNFQRRK